MSKTFGYLLTTWAEVMSSYVYIYQEWDQTPVFPVDYKLDFEKATTGIQYHTCTPIPCTWDRYLSTWGSQLYVKRAILGQSVMID